MNKSKNILLFSDLEGTLLGDSDLKYDDEAMYNFLLQIANLEKLTGAKVHIHLVSPVYAEDMKEVMNRINISIRNFNMLHPELDSLSSIECGGAYPNDNTVGGDFLDKNIIALKKSLAGTLDNGRYGKSHYVRSWHDIYSESETKDLIMEIYCGNGSNDLAAMEFISSQKNGFSICPQNAAECAKKAAFYVSQYSSLAGITDGLKMINTELGKRLDIQPKENTKDGESK